jgi:hypothetical protein
MGEAARKTPAQAELRPTCARACRIAFASDVTPHESFEIDYGLRVRWHRKTESPRPESSTFVGRHETIK